MSELDDRVRRIEDRLAIAELQARYTIFIDNHDLGEVAGLFAADARFRSADGIMAAVGRQAVCDQFRGRFTALGFGFHVTHDHLVELVDADHAWGVVSAHAEVVRNGQPMIAAIRYHDIYVREDGAWRFADRELRFFYYLPVSEYVDALPRRDRMRAYGDARPADLPENVVTFASSGGRQHGL